MKDRLELDSVLNSEIGPEPEQNPAPASPVDRPTPVDRPAVAPESGPGFGDLDLRAELLTALSDLGYEEPTPIQSQAIPILLEGRDLLGQAATGTGKTAAFALPALQTIVRENRPKEPTTLVLVPTRELAIQVSEAFYRYGRDLGARVVPIYGGQPIGRQLQALSRGVDVVVATPGRALDHIGRGTLALTGIRLVVLDEADEMLDMGFADDIEAILEATPQERQTVLFSATLPPRVDKIARRHLRQPARIFIQQASMGADQAPLVRQTAYIVARAHKAAALGRILDVESPTAAIVFCRTRIEVDQLTETLNGRGYRAEALHGGLVQEQRDRVMARLRTGVTELLVATDVAARGLDIDQLTHVVNYDVPSAPDSYVHRIGRVGRAGREGVAITLAEPRERRLLDNIERLIKQRISIERIPTVAELRTRQLELTIATLRETIVADDLERFNGVVDALAEEFDVIDVARAAVKLAHEASGAIDDDEEIPDVSSRGRSDQPGHGKGGRRGERGSQGRGAIARLYIGVGRSAGIRPKDLVGAIANETHLSGSEIGGITISDRFSIVEVPEAAVNEVISAMRHVKIKGKKTTVRRDLAR
ncbi:MAG TPA: DEAD/DEAH box helicase [Acidimicrobiia bacterium]|nr:DEAD/DEAH box helicase [Acidimicrobiia bacterium]